MTTMRELLRASPGARERAVRDAALRHPWTRPEDTQVACEPARAGEALLVTVTPPLGAALWRLSSSGVGGTALGAAARAAVAQADRLVTRELPLIVRTDHLAPRSWHVRIVAHDAGLPVLVDGPSIGLPAALAAASLLVDRPLPVDLASTGALAPDGSLLPVSGLARKVRMLAGWALAVRRLLVPAMQVDEAREAAQECGAGFEVIGAADLEHALRVAFPDLEGAAPAFVDPGAGRAAARRLFALALERSTAVLSWHGVARTAGVLASALPEGDPAGAEARFAHAVACRHDGRSVPLPWPEAAWLGRYPRPVRLRILAHVVATATELAAPDLPSVLERALWIAPSHLECDEGGLALRGAVGRGLARLRRYPEASAELDRTARAWFDLLAPLEASHPLSELCRVLGILGDARALAEALRCVEELVADPRLDPVSRAFLRLAGGRALLAVGDPRARELLDDPDIDWDATPDHLRAARLRALALAVEHGGRADEADELRAGIPEGRSRLLAALDVALARGGETAELVERLAADPPARLLLEDAPLHERAKRLADELPG